MIDFLFWLIAFIWFFGVCMRVYRQARFFQIEEYMSWRYLRWLFTARARWLPNRPLFAWLAGSLFAFMFSESPDGLLPSTIGIFSALIGVIPPDEGEIKKKFHPTSRARRMLGAAIVIAGVVFVGGVLFVSDILTGSAPEIRVIAVGTLGFIGFVCAPLWLIAGNIVMTPVEAVLRRRFISSARNVLSDINPLVIGITGSYGKTSTKLFLAHILNGRYKAYSTPKSYNTLMGVCIAINNDLADDHSIDYFICEMGAYVPGEIQRIAALTRPQISIVVDIGPQHLERFGSLENIAIAKYEIIKALPSSGVGVFNWDNLHVRAMVERGYPATRLTVSKTVDPATVQNALPRFVASEISETLDGITFRVTDTLTNDSEMFTTPLLGQHNITNLLLATAVAIHERMSLREVARRVQDLQPAESRLARRTTPEGVTIINDAYSANPVGIIGALHVLGLHTSGRRVLVTPGMVELGDLMATENQRLGERAAQHTTDVILVGAKQTEPIHTGLQIARFSPDHIHVVETLADALEWIKRNLSAGDTVLFMNDLPDTYTN